MGIFASLSVYIPASSVVCVQHIKGIYPRKSITNLYQLIFNAYLHGLRPCSKHLLKLLLAGTETRDLIPKSPDASPPPGRPKTHAKLKYPVPRYKARSGFLILAEECLTFRTVSPPRQALWTIVSLKTIFGAHRVGTYDFAEKPLH